MKLLVNGNHDLVGVSIDEEMLKDKTKIEDAIKEAWKDTTGLKFQMKLAKKMQDMGGLDMLKNLQ